MQVMCEAQGMQLNIEDKMPTLFVLLTVKGSH